MAVPPRQNSRKLHFFSYREITKKEAFFFGRCVCEYNNMVLMVMPPFFFVVYIITEEGGVVNIFLLDTGCGVGAGGRAQYKAANAQIIPQLSINKSPLYKYPISGY